MNGDFIVLNNDKEDIVEGREVPGDGIPVCNDFTVAKYFLSPEELVEWVKENTSLILENVIDQPVSRFSNQIQEIHPDYVINFNYTNTCEQYGINVQDICYIHGSVQDNNMVLGIRDIDEKDINSIYFKKFFQRIQKRTNTIQWDKFIEDHGLGSKFSIAHTYFFGHSLSNNDGDLIRSIYENSCKIIIYYLNSQKDYEQKVINLIDTLGKESVIQGMNSKKIDFQIIK